MSNVQQALKDIRSNKAVQAEGRAEIQQIKENISNARQKEHVLENAAVKALCNEPAFEYGATGDGYSYPGPVYDRVFKAIKGVSFASTNISLEGLGKDQIELLDERHQLSDKWRDMVFAIQEANTKIIDNFTPDQLAEMFKLDMKKINAMSARAVRDAERGIKMSNRWMADRVEILAEYESRLKNPDKWNDWETEKSILENIETYTGYLKESEQEVAEYQAIIDVNTI